jgi:ABC-type Fe3+ transport system substrate-binding protein
MLAFKPEGFDAIDKSFKDPDGAFIVWYVGMQGHLSVSRSVAAGTNIVTLDATTSTILNLKKAGQPIEFVFSDVDPIPIYYSTAGIFKDAPHPNVAKLYLTWVLAPEQQRRIGSFSSRGDVPPPAGLKPLFSYGVANDYRDFVTNDRLLADLRNRFAAAIGPIRNTGGVR